VTSGSMTSFSASSTSSRPVRAALISVMALS
jgi:hypothetical protein